MRFYHRLIRTLTLPSNAGPNDPAMVLGPDIPALITAYYAAFTETVYEIQIWRKDATHYIYEALLTQLAVNMPFVATGSVIGGVVQEITRIDGVGVAQIAGAHTGMIGSWQAIAPDGRFIIQNPSSLGFKTVTSSVQIATMVSTVGSRNVNTFANVPSGISVTFEKFYDASVSKIVCIYTKGAFGAAVNAQLRLGVDAGTGTAEGGRHFFNAGLVHFPVPGQSELTGLSRGSYTIHLTWAAQAGTVQCDGGDWDSLTAWEVPV